MLKNATGPDARVSVLLDELGIEYRVDDDGDFVTFRLLRSILEEGDEESATKMQPDAVVFTQNTHSTPISFAAATPTTPSTAC